MNISVRHKIIGLSFLGTIGLVLVGGLYYVGNSRQAAYQHRATHFHEIYARTKQTLIAMLEARRAEKDFLLRKNTMYIEKHRNLSKYVKINLKDLKTSMLDVGLFDMSKTIAMIEDAFLVYDKAFLTLANFSISLGLNEDLGIEGSLRQSAHAIEHLLKNVNEPSIMLALMMMRRYEKDLVHRHDIMNIPRVDSWADEFARLLAASTIPLSIKQDLTGHLSAYRDSFADMTTKIRDLERLQSVTSDAYAKIEPFETSVSETIDILSQETDTLAERYRVDAVRIMELSILLVIVVVTFVGFLIGRSIAKPLSTMTTAMLELAAGQFEMLLPNLGRRDEIGKMANAVEAFKTKALEKAQHEARAQTEQVRIRAAERRAEMQHLANEFEIHVGGVIKSVSAAATELEATAGSLAQTAKTTEQMSSAVASASEETYENVAAIAVATNVISSSINEISRTVENSSHIAEEAVKQAQTTNAKISELSQSASNIDVVTKLITAIAKQINMLALNATIEAAHAGQFGSGFAVVAQEIKELAKQTAKAIAEIEEQIAGVQSATQVTVGAIDQIGYTIVRFSTLASGILATIEEQGTATAEISHNIGQVAHGADQIASGIADVDRGTRDIGAASTQVLSAAHSLACEGDHLKIEVDRFLAMVRSA